MHVSREIATLAATVLILSACTSFPVRTGATYPLPVCVKDSDTDCVAPFFANRKLIAPRIPEEFPRQYLELWNKQVREDECKDPDLAKVTACRTRLEQLSAYFNPTKEPPASDKIGIALEGGGNKSAPFSLGVLAGINQMGLWDRVGAIGSVSGGSYAASFYFNRMLDLYLDDPEPTPGKVKQMRDAWFASCIPDAFSRGDRQHFPMFNVKPHACEELDNTQFTFNEKYSYQQQVWMHPDVLRLADDVPGDVDEGLHVDDLANVLALFAMTAATVPYQFVARTIFRWPVNSSPSRFAYRLGLEREYGYSPDDWRRALANTAVPVWSQTLQVRRGERTLTTLAKKVGNHAPDWIILSSAPGYIDGFAWAKPAPRDPIRQQFEITPTGFGSGTYGYARTYPDAPFDFFGAHPNGLPIFDAVVASAAFFDDNEINISKQPLRLLFGAVQQFGNVDWNSEIRNFNVSDRERTIERALVWPFYLFDTVKESKTPYIHLQDGGNAENAGILPLLRRGYRTIVYAHGTVDVEAQFAAICHLKNQLEFDGSYYIVSRDLQKLVDGVKYRSDLAKTEIPPGDFLNYLDQLCSQQIDSSDLAAFDRNELRKKVPPVSAVAKVFCGRMGRYDNVDDVAYPKRAQPDLKYMPCAEYQRRFRSYALGTVSEDGLPLTFPARRALFFQTSATPLRYHVCRGDALQKIDTTRAGGTPTLEKPVSTIIAVVPAVDWRDVKKQMVGGKIDPLPGDPEMTDWRALCETGTKERRQLAIGTCQAPDSTQLPAASSPVKSPATLLPCSTLAHVLEDKCKPIDIHADGRDIWHPAFPQDGVVRLTLHIPYPTYAAYFDLGRAQARRALGDPAPDTQFYDDDKDACAIPKALPEGVRPEIASPSSP